MTTLLLPTVGHAAPSRERTRVALMPLVIEGDVPLDVRSDARDEIEAALRNRDYTLVDGRPPGANCTTHECIHSVAEDADAQYVIYPALSTRDRDYAIALHLYDFGGNLKASEERTCEICSHDEVVESLVAAADAIEAPLLEYVANPYGDREEAESETDGPSTLSIRTDPPGAVVKLDGQRVGKTPLEIEVDPGLRDLEISRSNHNGINETIRAPRGGKLRLNYDLVENNEKQTRALRITGWTFSSVGILALGGGIAFLVLEERPVKDRCSGDNIDFNGACRYRYDTLLPGGLLTGFGVASLLTGITTGVIAYSRRTRKESKGALDTMDEDTISVRPLIGPTSAGVRVRF